MARRKLLNFKKRHGDAPVNFVEDEWLQPERFVARRPSPSNPGWEVLVKWHGQVGAAGRLGGGKGRERESGTLVGLRSVLLLCRGVGGVAGEEGRERARK